MITFGGYRNSRRDYVNSIQAGQTLLIEGSGFGLAKGTVTFLGVTAAVNAWSDTEINVVVPSLGTAAVAAPPIVNGTADPYTLTVTPGAAPPPPPPVQTFAASGTLTLNTDGTLIGTLTLKPNP